MDTMTADRPVAAQARTRADYEDFLYLEAAYLDQWKLDEWLSLYAEGATYEVPTAGSPDDADSATDLFYIADDYPRLQHRVKRLKKTGAHSEWPRSDAARLVTNVRILGSDENGTTVTCNFATYRSKNDITDVFVGHSIYVFTEVGGELKVKSKKVMLDMNNLRPQGRVSIIL